MALRDKVKVSSQTLGELWQKEALRPFQKGHNKFMSLEGGYTQCCDMMQFLQFV